MLGSTTPEEEEAVYCGAFLLLPHFKMSKKFHRCFISATVRKQEVGCNRLRAAPHLLPSVIFVASARTRVGPKRSLADVNNSTLIAAAPPVRQHRASNKCWRAQPPDKNRSLCLSAPATIAASEAQTGGETLGSAKSLSHHSALPSEARLGQLTRTVGPEPPFSRR